MCGIIGYADRNVKNKKKVLNKMMDAIKHRGPDSSGEYIDEERGVALGFRRLSIIDVKMGMQPIYNEDHSKAILFNGEIYNYQTIKKDLEKNHKFETDTDTEVILHGYEEYGMEGLLNKLRGMFAFVIYDLNTGDLVGARDHFGIKPFYYYLDNDTFLFGSEIKGFLEHPNFKKELNKKALKPYMTFQYSALKETFFKGVYRLPEGSWFSYKDGNLDIQKYWDIDFTTDDESFDTKVDEIDDVMKDSVNAHKISEVPVGSLLSSGVDSSYVTSLLRPEHTYSVGFDDKKYNESVAAKELADKMHIDNTSGVVTAQDTFDNFPLIQYYMDEPDSNPSCVPLYFLCKMASKDVTVVLSGEGADELFAGYANYGDHTNSKFIRRIAEKLKTLPKEKRYKFAEKIKGLPYFPGQRHLYESTAKAEDFFMGEAKIFDEDEAKEYLTKDYKESASVKEINGKIYKNATNKEDEVKKMQYLDIHQFMLKDILLKADKMSMANSIELRVPFLDKEVSDVARRIPTKHLLNENGSKWALRVAANRYLPEQYATRKKLGFPVPIKAWLQDDKFYGEVKALFEEDFAAEFFDQEKIIELLDGVHDGTTDNRRKVWTVYTFLVWYKVYFINDGKKPEVPAERDIREEVTE